MPEPDLVEPDDPAAWALAKHIADHPVSTIQAAFRYLNAPITIELHAPVSSAGRAPAADRAAVLREAADRIAELRAAEREWLPATGLHQSEQELRRLAGEAQQDEEVDDTIHACPGRCAGRHAEGDRDMTDNQVQRYLRVEELYRQILDLVGESALEQISETEVRGKLDAIYNAGKIDGRLTGIVHDPADSWPDNDRLIEDWQRIVDGV